MTNPVSHTIHAKHHHYVWDRGLPPVAVIAPGDVVEFEVNDSSGGQVTPRTTPEQVAGLDFSRINPASGPVRVDGAAPGDVLRVTVLDLSLGGWGWTANVPGFGLLGESFVEPALHIWSRRPGDVAVEGLGARVPLKPSAGCMGVAPARPGAHDILPPRRVGGTMNIRDLGVGATLYLPVEVEGALFSVGDVHAAQGDGEVCGTAIESGAVVTLGFDLVGERPLSFPYFEMAASAAGDGRGRHFATTGIGPDLMACARDAVAGMIDLLTREHGCRDIDAYMLCSICGDLRISEIVDRPNWVVSFYFPRSVFD